MEIVAMIITTVVIVGGSPAVAQTATKTTKTACEAAQKALPKEVFIGWTSLQRQIDCVPTR